MPCFCACFAGLISLLSCRCYLRCTIFSCFLTYIYIQKGRLHTSEKLPIFVPTGCYRLHFQHKHLIKSANHRLLKLPSAPSFTVSFPALLPQHSAAVTYPEMNPNSSLMGLRQRTTCTRRSLSTRMSRFTRTSTLTTTTTWRRSRVWRLFYHRTLRPHP